MNKIILIDNLTLQESLEIEAIINDLFLSFYYQKKLEEERK